MYKKLLAYTMEDMPIKKRRFWYHSVSPAAQTCSRTPKEPNSFEHLGDPEQQLSKSTFPESQKSHSEFGVIHGSVAVASSDGPSEPINPGNAEAPDAVVPMDKTVASMEPDSLLETESEDRKGLFVQVDSLTSSNNFVSDKNVRALGKRKSIPLKNDRSHWDLNIMMNEWEEPNVEIVNQHMSNIEYMTNDGIQNRKATIDPDSIQKIADPHCVLFETKGPDSERNVLQVSSGLIETEKTGAAFKTQDPTMFISMNDLNNKPCVDHTECEFIGQKFNTANIPPMQYDKDMSGTPATVLCKLSSQSETTEKSDSVSFGMPIIGKPACYVDSMNDDGSDNLKINSGKDPKLTSEDLSSGCNNSNVSGNHMGHVVSVECMSNLQSGYDSPIEDGELREPYAYIWKNNEVDFSETGQLDNGLVGTDYVDAFENNYKNGNQLCDHQDGANAKGQDCELDDNGSQTREFGARAYRKKLSSYDETTYNGPMQRKHFEFMQHQRKYENNGCDADFPVTYQESRSYYPHSYRDSMDHYHSRLRRVNSGPPARGSEMSFYNNRQFADKFSNDIYRPSPQKRIPADRDDSNDSYRRAPFPRGKNKRNKKKKSGFYPQRGMRAPKKEYNEPWPEQYSGRRDHNFSMNFDQAAHINRPYRKSQSESSLCSPTHASNEQDQRSSDRVSRHIQRQRGNQVEFPRRWKSNGNFRSLAVHEINPQVIANDRECSFENNDIDRNMHYGNFEEQVLGNVDIIDQNRL